MKSRVLLLLGALVLAGCSSKDEPKAPQTVSSSKIDNAIALRPDIKYNIDVNQVVRGGQRDGYNIANSYYAKGEFNNAIVAFDAVCASFQFYPACEKMAEMYEKGEGTQVNKAIALDIYQRGCFSGHDHACDDMRRLESALR